MDQDSDFNDAMAEAREMHAEQLEHEARHGTPDYDRRKVIYVARGCTDLCDFRFGEYHIHHDTPAQRTNRMMRNQDLRIIPVDK